jgi:hypothetical protein
MEMIIRMPNHALPAAILGPRGISFVMLSQDVPTEISQNRCDHAPGQLLLLHHSRCGIFEAQDVQQWGNIEGIGDYTCRVRIITLCS